MQVQSVRERPFGHPRTAHCNRVMVLLLVLRLRQRRGSQNLGLLRRGMPGLEDLRRNRRNSWRCLLVLGHVCWIGKRVTLVPTPRASSVTRAGRPPCAQAAGRAPFPPRSHAAPPRTSRDCLDVRPHCRPDRRWGSPLVSIRVPERYTIRTAQAIQVTHSQNVVTQSLAVRLVQLQDFTSGSRVSTGLGPDCPASVRLQCARRHPRSGPAHRVSVAVPTVRPHVEQ